MALGISVFSLRGRWDSVRLRLVVDATKKNLQKDLSAHVYIDAAAEDAAAVLQRMGGTRAILATGTSGHAMGRLAPGLAARGKLIVVNTYTNKTFHFKISSRTYSMPRTFLY